VNGLVDPSFLVDGYVAGTWKLTQTKRETVLDITPFDAPLPTSTRVDLEAEGQRLLGFLVPEAAQREVSIRDSVDA